MKAPYLVMLFIFFAVSEALKCQTDEGPSEDSLRRVLQKCIKTATETSGFGNGNVERNSTESTSREYDEKDDSEDDDSSDGSGDDKKNKNRNKDRNFESRRTTSGYDNNYGVQNESISSMSDHDKNCIIHCFLVEMRMTNENNQLPDKNKVSQVLTKDLKNRELRSFLQDSVTECFQILELDHRKEKCDFSKNLVSCLAERGKANCEDWDNSSTLPF